MSRKHYGKGGRGKMDEDYHGDMANDYWQAGEMRGLKRALSIIAESSNLAAAYKRIRLIIRNDGWEKKGIAMKNQQFRQV